LLDKSGKYVFSIYNDILYSQYISIVYKYIITISTMSIDY